MYLYYDDKYELDKVITALDTPTNKKMAKKEILPLLTELAKKSGLNYEAIMKEDPDIYAKFLKLEWPDIYECKFPFKLNENEGTSSPPPTHAPKMIGNKMVFGKMEGLIGDKIVFNQDTAIDNTCSNGESSKRLNDDELPETKRVKLDNGVVNDLSLPP